MEKGAQIILQTVQFFTVEGHLPFVFPPTEIVELHPVIPKVNPLGFAPPLVQ